MSIIWTSQARNLIPDSSVIQIHPRPTSAGGFYLLAAPDRWSIPITISCRVAILDPDRQLIPARPLGGIHGLVRQLQNLLLID